MKGGARSERGREEGEREGGGAGEAGREGGREEGRESVSSCPLVLMPSVSLMIEIYCDRDEERTKVSSELTEQSREEGRVEKVSCIRQHTSAYVSYV